MPKDRDLKKLVRARMAKTGESYSIAKLRLAGATKLRGAVARSSSASIKASAAPAIYRVKISLADIAPAIWRRLVRRYVPRSAPPDHSGGLWLVELPPPPIHRRRAVLRGAGSRVRR